MNLNSVKSKITSRVRGLLSDTISYEIRNPQGDWSAYFGQYEGQKHDDLDTNCCWAYAGNECLEDSLEFLMKTNKFSQLELNWFKNNGYIDEDGDFYLSRRFIPILSGVKNKGNDEAEFWRLSQIYGAIPNKILPYTNNTDYFDKAFVTQEMYDLGKEFLKKIDIKCKEVGNRFEIKSFTDIKAALLQSELQIGISVPTHVTNWNSGKVKWDGSTQIAHSVAFYKLDEAADYDYPIFIYDQYEPRLKQLSRNYPLLIVTYPVVTVKSMEPIGDQKVSFSIVQQFLNILRKIGLWK